MATRLPFSSEQWWNACKRNAYKGAKMFTYEAGTTTPKTTYTTAAESVAHANPILADANGIFPEIYGDGAYYIEVLNNAEDDIIIQADNILGVGTSSFTQYGTMDDARGADGEVGDFVETYEYVAGSRVGGGKYEIVAGSPSEGSLSPQKTDGSGNYLQFKNDYDFITQENMGLSSSSPAATVVSELNTIYPALRTKNWSLSLTEILDANGTINISVPTYSRVRGEGGFNFINPAAHVLQGISLFAEGARCQSLSITLDGNYSRIVTYRFGDCHMEGNIISATSSATNNNIFFSIFAVPDSVPTPVKRGSFIGNDLQATAPDQVAGFFGQYYQDMIVTDNKIHDLVAPNTDFQDWAIYVAHTSYGCKIERNLVQDVATSGIHQHAGNLTANDPNDFGRTCVNNVLDTVGFIGVAFESTTGGKCYGNEYRGCSQAMTMINNNHGLYVGGESVRLLTGTGAVGVVINDGKDVVVDGITFASSSNGNVTTCMDIVDSVDCSISNVMTINSNAPQGFLVRGSSDGTKIHDCHHEFPSGQSLVENAYEVSSSGITVTNCSIVGEVNPTDAIVGMRVSSDTTVHSNIVQGFKTQVFNSSAGASYKDNLFIDGEAAHVFNNGSNTEYGGNTFDGGGSITESGSGARYINNDMTGITSILGSATDNIISGNHGFADNLSLDTSTNLALKAANINILDKYTGKVVTDTVSNDILYADGPLDTDPWKTANVSVTITPI